MGSNYSVIKGLHCNLCVQAVKALIRLYACAGSSESLLVTDVKSATNLVLAL